MSSKNNYHILINASSGFVQKTGVDELKKMIRDNGLADSKIEFYAAHELEDRVEKSVDEKTTLMIGGGDGTINIAASHYHGSGKGFAILPMGTMNLMAQDLSLPLDIAQACQAYSKGTQEVKVDVGFANDRLYLCNASLGTIPIAADYREEHRGESDMILVPRLTAFILEQMDEKKQREITLTYDGKTKKTRVSSVVISNNTFYNQDNILNNAFERKGLQNEELGIYTITPKSFWDRIRLIFRYRAGFWKSDSVIREYIAKDVRIDTVNDEEAVSLDGETTTLSTPVKFHIEPQSLTFLLPKREQ